jgi:hypothetical protein
VLADRTYTDNARILAGSAAAGAPVELGAHLVARAPDLYRLGLDVTGQPLSVDVARRRPAPRQQAAPLVGAGQR